MGFFCWKYGFRFVEKMYILPQNNFTKSAKTILKKTKKKIKCQQFLVDSGEKSSTSSGFLRLDLQNSLS